MQRLMQLRDGAKRPAPKELLLARADEPLRDAVPLRGPDEGRARGDPEEAEFGPEGVAHVVAAMIGPQLQACADACPESAKAAAHGLTNRLQRFKARADFCRMHPPSLQRAVGHRDEHGRLALLDRPGARGIGAPHLVGPLRGERAVVDAGRPAGCQEARGAHEAQHARLGGADALGAEPAHTLRWPSPRNGDAAIPCRMWAVRDSPCRPSSGPAWPTPAARAGGTCCAEQVDRASPHSSQTRPTPSRRFVEGDEAWLIASASRRLKGRQPSDG